MQRASLREALRLGERYLQERGVEDAAVDAWLLLEYVTGITRTVFLAESRQEMPEESLARYQELLAKRGNHIPLQHLTGVQEFMGFPFRVNEHVLIPRQDTEILVEEALKRLQPGMRVLDMCTGSGCIAVSLAKLCEASMDTGSQKRQKEAGAQKDREAAAMQKNQDAAGINSLTVDAADISPEALAVAAENASRLGADVRFLCSDLFAELSGTYDMIVSNPPYIRSAVIEELAEEVRCHEPYQALDGKADGLYFYRRIIREGRKYLGENGWLLFEIGYDQAAQVTELLAEAGFRETETVKDLAGLDRVVLGRYPG
ncbi:MAG: peptide chain release factor N(5)-glutamine methyltransferase [Lachnospiraceae bacterium]|nr:peptide chain release factor N(5)-glutamine methyltransferase [Lachnospiraceae bacterium]